VSPGRREPLDSRSADAPAERLLKIRQTLVDRIWRGLFFVALVGAPASVSRSVTTGWLRLYSFHLAVALLRQLPALSQQRNLVLASDQWRQSCLRRGLEATGRVAHADDAIGTGRLGGSVPIW